MDYIRPADCKAEDFRSMWAEFEWENKVRHYSLFPSISTFILSFARSDTIQYYMTE
jgi:coatomer subunit beta